MWNPPSQRRWPLGACLLSVGCSAILNIDGHYVEGQKGTRRAWQRRGVRTEDAGPTRDRRGRGRRNGWGSDGGTEAESGGASTGGVSENGGVLDGRRRSRFWRCAPQDRRNVHGYGLRGRTQVLRCRTEYDQGLLRPGAIGRMR